MIATRKGSRDDPCRAPNRPNSVPLWPRPNFHYHAKPPTRLIRNKMSDS